MAQARNIKTYEKTTVVKPTIKNEGAEMQAKEVKTVKKPVAMINHKQTKQFKDGEKTVEKAKEVKTVKKTRIQIIEEFELKISSFAQSNVALSKEAMKLYLAIFQLESYTDFMAMVQSVSEEGDILLKSGYNLPILPEEDLMEFMQLFTSIVDINNAPAYNVVNFKMSNPEFDERTALFTYALFELVGAGRRAPNIEWDDVESTSPFDVTQDGKYSAMYMIIDAYIADSENEAGALKGALESLAPNAFAAFNGFFNKESFKKIGLTISSHTEGMEAVLTPAISENIGNLVYDIFGDYAVIIEDEEDEEEVEAEPVGKQVTSQKNTPKQKVEAKPAPVVEDEDEDDIEEDDDTEYDDDEDGLDYGDDIDEDEDDIEEMDDEDEEDYE